ncbi:hypothetical protein V5268_005180, partial [Escherichia coli]
MNKTLIRSVISASVFAGLFFGGGVGAAARADSEVFNFDKYINDTYPYDYRNKWEGKMPGLPSSPGKVPEVNTNSRNDFLKVNKNSMNLLVTGITDEKYPMNSANPPHKSVTALGIGASVEGEGTTVVGVSSKATGKNATAVGTFSSAATESSTALGAQSKAGHKNSVAIGAGASTTRENEVYIGYQHNGNETGTRVLGGLSDGTLKTDATTKGQMDRAIEDVQKKSYGYTDVKAAGLKEWAVGEMDALRGEVGGVYRKSREYTDVKTTTLEEQTERKMDVLRGEVGDVYRDSRAYTDKQTSFALDKNGNITLDESEGSGERYSVKNAVAALDADTSVWRNDDGSYTLDSGVGKRTRINDAVVDIDERTHSNTQAVSR